MSIKVRIQANLRRYTGGRDILETTGKTIGECLDNLESQFPGIKQLYLITNKPEKLSTPVKDGDEFGIVVFIGGG